MFPFPIEDTWPTTIAGREMDSYHRWMEVSVPGTLSGCPVISIPAGFGGEHDLPMGLQMIGRPRDDRSLLQLARWWELAAPWVHLAPPEPGSLDEVGQHLVDEQLQTPLGFLERHVARR